MRTTHFLILLSAAIILPAATLTAMEPAAPTPAPMAASIASPEYNALQNALIDYQVLEANGGWPQLKGTDKKIAPESKDARISTIREILSKTGDYTGYDQSDIYDVDLQVAVRLFQLRHGLTADGVIGKSTLEALAVPVEKRIAQIKGTLARMAEFDAPTSSRYILVNLPEYRLRGYANGTEAITMKVIVGAPKTRTPTFNNEISYVSFNPHWGVPDKIARNELLPKIRSNPEYAASHNYVIYNMSSEGREEVSAGELTAGGHYQIRQRPGKGNALGKIKFGMVGTDDIYLHDTASPNLFAKDDRALSHGCVRVERPRDLAHYVLGSMANFSGDKIDTLYDSDTSKTVKADALPVRLVYWTARVDQSTGKVHFSKDIYNQDKI